LETGLKYHHHGYVSSDPRIQTPAGVGINRPEELPEQVDVLIVGAGPAGMIAAAQLSQFPGIVTRIVERRAGRLEIGLADGMQKRSIETFEAFGFAQQLIAEACQVTETAFWKPDPKQPKNIMRLSRVDEDPQNVSEYPHLTVNHARVLDYFAEFMENAPTRMKPDYGYEFVDLAVADEGDYPVTVNLTRTTGEQAGQERVVRARYVLGVVIGPTAFVCATSDFCSAWPRPATSAIRRPRCTPRSPACRNGSRTWKVTWA
jgi:phenol 2-monooxygenase